MLTLKEIKGKGNHFCLSFSRNMDTSCLAFNLTDDITELESLSFMSDHFETPRVKRTLNTMAFWYSQVW